MDFLIVEGPGSNGHTDVVVGAEEGVDGGVFVDIKVHNVGTFVVVLENEYFLLEDVLECLVAGDDSAPLRVLAFFVFSAGCERRYHDGEQCGAKEETMHSWGRR